ncbi:hypothetical protein Dda_7323 [Drechslerella dactyloides]|uniref:Uncharacterized protein n=1 Tax=Drechslerella dactyloides TaxID=74499 RepID=A0AAD6IRZ0_DREDA|nr:hypothetical protein Dda_7323 [Drechslerella dactyloides]
MQSSRKSVIQVPIYSEGYRLVVTSAVATESSILEDKSPRFNKELNTRRHRLPEDLDQELKRQVRDLQS